jgi:hypothetical protein
MPCGAKPESLIRSDLAAAGIRRRRCGRTIAAVLGDLGRDSDFGDLAPEAAPKAPS